MPAYAAEIPKASVFASERLTPDEMAAIGASRTARSERPNGPRRSSQASANRTAPIDQVRYEIHAFSENAAVGDESKLVCSPPPPPVKLSYRLATSGTEIARPKVASAR